MTQSASAISDLTSDGKSVHSTDLAEVMQLNVNGLENHIIVQVISPHSLLSSHQDE